MPVLSERASSPEPWMPDGTSAASAGYLAPALIEIAQKSDLSRVRGLALKVLQDPLLQRELCDRVYELMLKDLRTQKERLQNYGERC